MRDDPKPGVTRREALKLLGLGAAGSLTGAAASCARKTDTAGTRRCDVVIVGAGLSGLAAARMLTSRGKSVVVLDARDRVGGRVKAGSIAGRTIDLGGMWAGRSQTRLLALLQEHGVATVPQFLAGKCITEIRGNRYVGDGETPVLRPSDDAELARLSKRLDLLAAEVPVDSPWTAPEAAAWDRVTVDEWIRSETKNETVRALMGLVARGVLSAEPQDLSLLFFLFSMRSGNSFEEVWGMKEGAQAFLVSGGMHQLATRMAKRLGPALVLRAPVTAVRQDAAGVTVEAPGGPWRAERAIVAIPLPLSARISYDPVLPPQRDALAQRSPMASVVKYWIAYREPFWRRQGWNALIETDEPPTDELADASPPDAGVGLIVGFIEPRLSLEWGRQPLEQRRARLAERIAHFLGPEGSHPIDYVENDWPAETWTRGCYGAIMGPGVLTSLGPYLRPPFGRIHWAGTETSAAWAGYIEGAIRSGERAAAEVLGRGAPA